MNISRRQNEDLSINLMEANISEKKITCPIEYIKMLIIIT